VNMNLRMMFDIEIQSVQRSFGYDKK